MTDFRTTKQALYCTPMDVRQMLQIFEREVFNSEDELQTGQSIPDQKIEQHIYSADATICSYLASIYGESAFLASTPYFLGPIPLADNQTKGATLRGIVVANSAITEQWLVEFTANDAFTVKGSVSGSQGSGTVAANFTSTNSDIQIKAEDWDKAGSSVISSNNRFLIGTYKTKPIIRMMSAKLAASELINSVYSLSESEGPTWARQLRKDVIDLLKEMVDPKSDVTLTGTNPADVNWMEAVSYAVDRYGKDVSPYSSITDDVNPLDI